MESSQSMENGFFCSQCGKAMFYDIGEKSFTCLSCGNKMYLMEGEALDIVKYQIKKEEKERKEKRQKVSIGVFIGVVMIIIGIVFSLLSSVNYQLQMLSYWLLFPGVIVLIISIIVDEIYKLTRKK